MQYDYEGFSQLAGPYEPARAEPGRPYRVRYRSIIRGRDRWQLVPLLVVTLVLSSLFFLWLIQPSHYPKTKYLSTALVVGNGVMFWTIVFTEGMRLFNSITVCLASWYMRDPVPVPPRAGMRVAFVTTVVPSKEPLHVVRATLEGALGIWHDGILDIWLLDEGDDPNVWRMCSELGVHHFTRKGVEEWNRPKGRFKAKTKHGNHNAWLAAYGGSYDIVVSVDPDHIPLPNFCERLLGYFRDPDVAFVVGPQVYGNWDNYITKAAESQNYMFHSVIQRSANRWGCGMFVGTNHAYRVAAWEQIGGFQDSITEDLATSLAIHGARNPRTGNRWRSVYTPDVLAVGEGPATWTDYFSQQLRWARGANEVAVTNGISRLFKLSWAHKLHYSMIMTYYPTVALTWLLGIMLTTLYMALGATGVTVQIDSWLALYIDIFLARSVLYFALRRFNISPHEEIGSSGMAGIVISLISTPFYSSAFVAAVLRRKAKFVVTPKGENASADRLVTFRKHLFWAAVSVGSLSAAVLLGHEYPANMVWTAATIVVCVVPVVMWRVLTARQLRQVIEARAGTTGALPTFETTSSVRDAHILEDVAG